MNPDVIFSSLAVFVFILVMLFIVIMLVYPKELIKVILCDIPTYAAISISKYSEKYYKVEEGKWFLYNIKYKWRHMYWILTIQEYCMNVYFFLFRHLISEEQKKEMKGVFNMALRGVDCNRLNHYVFESERITDKLDPQTGKPVIMTVDEAYRMAEQCAFSVVDWRNRSARMDAAERDNMIDVTAAGKDEIKQRINSGSADLTMLLSCIEGWNSILAPEGKCERCGGIEHKGDYLDFNELINSAANKGKEGIYKKEIAIDHLSESMRKELATHMRESQDKGKLEKK